MPTSTSLDQFLAAMEYPATRDDLLREAARDGLSADDRALLAELPEQSYSAARSIRYRLVRDSLTKRTPQAPKTALAA